MKIDPILTIVGIIAVGCIVFADNMYIKIIGFVANATCLLTFAYLRKKSNEKKKEIPIPIDSENWTIKEPIDINNPYDCAYIEIPESRHKKGKNISVRWDHVDLPKNKLTKDISDGNIKIYYDKNSGFPLGDPTQRLIVYVSGR